MSQSSSGTSLSPEQLAAAGQNAASSGGNLTFFNNSGSPAPTTGGNGSPLLSQDSSAFSQYTLSTIQGNPIQAGNIPGLQSATTIGQALQDFMDMPPAQLQQLQMQLWDAGFYVNADGSPMSAADIHFGSPGDPASWTAFTRALSEASSSGASVSTVLQGRIQQGAGTSNLLPQPTTGGANVYTIDLSNPTTVKYVADQVFQATLGRNATSDEVTNVTTKLRSQETQQGLAREQGQEQQSRSSYQTQVNQKNIAYENATNPNLSGQIPTGPFNTPQDWATALLSYMNMPVTTSNVAAIASWAQKTGKFNDGSFNPLDTSRPEGGSTTGPNGSQEFQNWAQGLQATASMLMNGKYSALTSALQNGSAADAVKNDPTVKQELNTWSDGHFSSLTVDSATTQTAADAVATFNNTNKPGMAGYPATAQSMGAEGGGPNASGGGTAQSMGAEGGGPNAVAQTGMSTVSPANVSEGQQPPNPGDTYINPVTVYDQAPADASAQAYQEATTGNNRIPYAGNQFLKAYDAVLALIKNGGPTG